jgi:predicted  nucleic acid-binding Zn-ribbon protein
MNNECLLCGHTLDNSSSEFKINCPNCHTYYLDHAFKAQLRQFKDFYPLQYHHLISKMQELIKTHLNKANIFFSEFDESMDEESILHINKNLITYYYTFNEVANLIDMDVSSNSRGSDYGD